jgi:uncharacterized protein YjdB
MRIARQWIGVLVVVALSACGGGGDLVAPGCDAIGAALVTRVEVQPASVALTLGDSAKLEATAFSCAGPLTIANAWQWRSGDTTVARINDMGWVTARMSGTAQVTASMQAVTGQTVVTATPAVVARVQVEPDPATVGVGRTSTLTARAFDLRNRELTGRPVVWSSADPRVVAVDAGGRITGVAAGGPVSVTATIEGQQGRTQVRAVVGPVTSITVTPSTATVQAASSTQLTAVLRDELGNVITGRAVNWTTSDPAIATVSGAGGLVLGRRPGVATISATVEGRSSTSTVTVVPGAPTLLRFVQQPSAALAGATITPAVTVEVLDGAGNRVTAAATQVTVALIPSSPASLGGTTTVAAANGLATFGTLTVSQAGTYALTVSAAGLVSGTSTALQVTERPPVRLAFVQQPTTTATAGMSLGEVTVEVLDATGSRVRLQSVTITLGLDANPGSGTLAGTVSATTVNGLATFSTLRIERAAAGYTLRANAAGLVGVTSTAFTITPAAARRLAFRNTPCQTGCRAGSPLTPAPVVAVTDDFGNTVTTSTASVELRLRGGGKARLSGTTRVGASGGIATFSSVTVNVAGSGLTIEADADGLASATSAPFTVEAASR